MLSIVNIANPTDLRDITLRSRADQAHCERSLEFVALSRGQEVGLLSYEDRSDEGSAFVYEIFVLPAFRRQGIGLFLLLHAEQQAIRFNCKLVRLKPYALDTEPTQSRLKTWYSSLGYHEVKDDPEHMEKALS